MKYTMLIKFDVIVDYEEGVKTCTEMANDIGQFVCDEMTTANNVSAYNIEYLSVSHDPKV